jgi:glycosyltransferase involved in cell wall biosynthesis
MVAHHVFMDNGSRDGTLDILRSLQHEGLSLSVFQNRCVSFNEANHLTFMFKQAVATHAADWVACLDVDEFLDNRQVGSSLAAILEKLENAYPDINCVKLPTVDYIATTQDDASEVIIPERIRKRRAVSDNYKAIVRGGAANGNVQIQSGGHGIAHADRPGTTVLQNELRLAHYSERSAFQYIVKFVRGWNRVLAAGGAVAASGLAHHYKNPYEALLDNPAELLRNNWFMGFKNETPDLIDDPIQYLGGALRYTRAQDEAMRAVQGLMGTLDALALRHGALLDDLPDAKQHVAALDSHHEKIF